MFIVNATKKGKENYFFFCGIDGEPRVFPFVGGKADVMIFYNVFCNVVEKLNGREVCRLT